MAENDTSHSASASDEGAADQTKHGTQITKRTSGAVAPRNTAVTRRTIRRAERAALKATRPKARPVRSVGTLAAIFALVAGVAVPAAVAATQGGEEPVSVHDAAAGQAQSLTVQSQATAPKVAGSSYAASTPEEIEQKKAEEAAIERAKQLQAQQEQNEQLAGLDEGGEGEQAPPPPQSLAAPGQVVNPLPYWDYIGDGFGAPRSGRMHEGVDFLVGAGTPIYAIADGCVSVSSESYGAYGAAVVLDSNVGGSTVSSTYAHMTYGTRAVAPGECVSAGQLLGQVGSTGSSTANHLHFEVRVNGGLVDPWAWLQSNVG